GILVRPTKVSIYWSRRPACQRATGSSAPATSLVAGVPRRGHCLLPALPCPARGLGQVIFLPSQMALLGGEASFRAGGGRVTARGMSFGAREMFFRAREMSFRAREMVFMAGAQAAPPGTPVAR